MVTKHKNLYMYILVDFNFDNPGDVTTLSPFFKAAVSFTINIPIWVNSYLMRTTLSC